MRDIRVEEQEASKSVYQVDEDIYQDINIWTFPNTPFALACLILEGKI